MTYLTVNRLKKATRSISTVVRLWVLAILEFSIIAGFKEHRWPLSNTRWPLRSFGTVIFFPEVPSLGNFALTLLSYLLLELDSGIHSFSFARTAIWKGCVYRLYIDICRVIALLPVVTDVDSAQISNTFARQRFSYLPTKFAWEPASYINNAFTCRPSGDDLAGIGILAFAMSRSCGTGSYRSYCQPWQTLQSRSCASWSWKYVPLSSIPFRVCIKFLIHPRSWLDQYIWAAQGIWMHVLWSSGRYVSILGARIVFWASRQIHRAA